MDSAHYNDDTLMEEDASLPATCWKDIPLDVWSGQIFRFVGAHQYRFVGGVCKTFEQAYSHSFPEKTTYYDMSSFERAKVCFDDDSKSNNRSVHLLAQKSASHCRTRTVKHWYDRICDEAIKNRDSALLTWLRGIDHPDEKRACYSAAARGDLESLKWARRHGCTWDESIFDCAEGHFDVSIWLARHRLALWQIERVTLTQWARPRANDCVCDEETFRVQST